MILEPGQKTHWHSDACHRFTVVVRGSELAIEFKDSGETVVAMVRPGLADWDGPEPRPHRATNTGPDTYEEIVTFYRNSSETDPQPEIP